MPSDIEVNIRTVLDAAGMARARSQLSADAQAAGNEVEQTLGESGRRAGDQMAEGIGQGMDSAGGTIGDKLSGLLSLAGPLAGAVGAAAAALGASVAGDFMDGLGQGFNAQRGAALRAIRTGLEPEELGALGDEAGALYARGFGEGLSEMKDAAATVQQNLQGIDQALDTGQITRYAATFEEAFGIAIPDQTRLARRLIANELAPDAVAAFDMIGAAAVGFGDQMDQGLDVLDEFAPTFRALGIDGASAVQLITDGIQQGLFTNIDRAGDMWLELRNRIVTSDDAREAVQGLGLDFENLRSELAQGGEVGEQALQRLVGALLAIEDDAQLAAAAVEIFGVNLEEVSDPRHAFELIQQALAMEDVQGSAEELATTLESAATEWETFSRRATQAGADMGESLAGLANQALEVRDFFSEGLGVEEFAASVGGATPEVAELSDGIQEWGVVAEAAARIQAELAAEAEAATQHFMFHNDAVAETADSYRIFQAEIESVADALAGVAAQYDADALFRRLQEEIAGAIDATNGLEGATYDLETGFNTETEAGRAAEAAVEDIGRAMLVTSARFVDGSVTAEQFADSQRTAEAGLREVAAQLGLNEAQTRRLIAAYLAVPDRIYTEAEANVRQALIDAGVLKSFLDGMDGRTIYTYAQHRTDILTYYRTVGSPGPGSAVVGYRTSSGFIYADGGDVWSAQDGITASSLSAPILVNDGAGQESATLPSGDLVRLPIGSRIHTAEDTEAMAQAGAFGGGRGTELHVHVHAGSVIAGERGLIQTIREAWENGDFDQQLQAGGT